MLKMISRKKKMNLIRVPRNMIMARVKHLHILATVILNVSSAWVEVT